MKKDVGSTVPLLIGLAAVLLGVVFAVSDLQSLLLQKQRALSQARFSALFIAKELAGSPPVIGLDYSSAVLAELEGAESVKIVSLDGKTFTATVCVEWKSPLGLHPVSEVCDTARSRVIY